MTQTVESIGPLIHSKDIWIVADTNYTDQIAAHSPGVLRKQIIEEPFPLGSNLAVGLGVIHILREAPEAVIMVCWADTRVDDISGGLSTDKIIRTVTRGRGSMPSFKKKLTTKQIKSIAGYVHSL